MLFHLSSPWGGPGSIILRHPYVNGENIAVAHARSFTTLTRHVRSTSTISPHVNSEASAPRFQVPSHPTASFSTHAPLHLHTHPRSPPDYAHMHMDPMKLLQRKSLGFVQLKLGFKGTLTQAAVRVRAGLGGRGGADKDGYLQASQSKVKTCRRGLGRESDGVSGDTLATSAKATSPPEILTPARSRLQTCKTLEPRHADGYALSNGFHRDRVYVHFMKRRRRKGICACRCGC